ncbi:LPXTG cell wall anchor domain-containing protein [Aminobacter sp. AP02]|uniref:LPXTG cell wall anchor domain-containing protein n=1 Tax=Aminobacter sp. AP02 TaxID=2135737 RepID=UPI001FE17803|nr:LPXTG cell wall anchor domain-containing protein [Aminobacter sp. AP02]
MNKLTGLIAIIIGFLVAAEGYRSGSSWLIILGIVVLAVGLGLLLAKIARRNQGGQL